MAIMKSPGSAVIDADDLQFTTHGITWGVKFREYLPDWRHVFILRKSPNGSWISDNLPEGNISNDFDGDIGRVQGSVERYIAEVLVPKLNAWLAKTFVAGQTPVPVEDEIFVKVFNAAKAIKINAKADGTVVVSI